MTDSRESRVLIIDDDKAIAKAIATRLESLGYQCMVAHTGARGFVEFHCRGADLVVTDLNMPAGDGVSVITRIRKVTDVPIIVVTAFKADYEPHLGSVLNISVLEKPFDSDELIAIVETRLSAALSEGPNSNARSTGDAIEADSDCRR